MNKVILTFPWSHVEIEQDLFVANNHFLLYKQLSIDHLHRQLLLHHTQTLLDYSIMAMDNDDYGDFDA